MLNNKSKDDALKALTEAQRSYEIKQKQANLAVQNLYKTRKKALKTIESVEDFIKKQLDIKIEDIKIFADAKASIRLFTESVQSESKMSVDDLSNKYLGATVAGTVTGTAIATMGPSALIAIATTFGTASTGAAISTLSGAAATSAALAWLGGGALAVGGAGVSGGAATLSLLGPVGWTIAGIAVLGGVATMAKKNKEIAEKAQKTTLKINRTIKKMDKAINTISELSSEITELSDWLTSAISKKQTHTQNSYTDIIDNMVKLCSKINQKVSL